MSIGRMVVSWNDTSTKIWLRGRNFRLSGPGRFGCKFPHMHPYVFYILRWYIIVNTIKMLSLDFLDDVRRMNKRQVCPRLLVCYFLANRFPVMSNRDTKLNANPLAATSITRCTQYAAHSIVWTCTLAVGFTLEGNLTALSQHINHSVHSSLVILLLLISLLWLF